MERGGRDRRVQGVHSPSQGHQPDSPENGCHAPGEAVADADIFNRSCEVALLEPGEAAAAYKTKILSYQAGGDFLELQAAAPDNLASLIEGLSAAELARRPAPEKWSIQEIVAHLADDELVGGYRLRMILSAPGTAIQAFVQDIWARTGRYDRT